MNVIQKDKHTHTHPFNGTLSGTTRVGQYQKGKTNLDFTEARDSEWQWHQLGLMQVCTSLQAANHASTPPLSFLQARCPSCCPTNSVKGLKAKQCQSTEGKIQKDKIETISYFAIEPYVKKEAVHICTDKVCTDKVGQTNSVQLRTCQKFVVIVN